MPKSRAADRPQRCVRCGRYLRRISFLSGVVGPGRPPLVRIECEHYACLDSLCWSTSDGRHLIANDCTQHAPPGSSTQETLW